MKLVVLLAALVLWKSTYGDFAHTQDVNVRTIEKTAHTLQKRSDEHHHHGIHKSPEETKSETTWSDDIKEPTGEIKFNNTSTPPSTDEHHHHHHIKKRSDLHTMTETHNCTKRSCDYCKELQSMSKKAKRSIEYNSTAQTKYVHSAVINIEPGQNFTVYHLKSGCNGENHTKQLLVINDTSQINPHAYHQLQKRESHDIEKQPLKRGKRSLESLTTNSLEKHDSEKDNTIKYLQKQDLIEKDNYDAGKVNPIKPIISFEEASDPVLNSKEHVILRVGEQKNNMNFYYAHVNEHTREIYQIRNNKFDLKTVNEGVNMENQKELKDETAISGKINQFNDQPLMRVTDAQQKSTVVTSYFTCRCSIFVNADTSQNGEVVIAETSNKLYKHRLVTEEELCVLHCSANALHSSNTGDKIDCTYVDNHLAQDSTSGHQKQMAICKVYQDSFGCEYSEKFKLLVNFNMFLVSIVMLLTLTLLIVLTKRILSQCKTPRPKSMKGLLVKGMLEP